MTHSNIAERAANVAPSIYGLKLHVLSSGDGFNLFARKPWQVKKPASS